MTTFVIVLTSGIFALAAVIGLIDMLVHLVCKGAQALRTPDALHEQEHQPAAAHSSVQRLAA